MTRKMDRVMVVGIGAIAVVFVAISGIACTPTPVKQPTFSPETKATVWQAPLVQGQQPDAVPEQQFIVQLMMHQITLPYGAVSRSEDFWKRINEQAVDVSTYELLYKNGVRCGVAQASEWDYFKKVLEQNPAVTRTSTFGGVNAKDIVLEMKKNVEYQNLFHIDQNGDLVGRTFEKCDNLIHAEFMNAPRKPGSVRLTLCPVVKSLRERLVPIGNINVTSVERVFPEHIYDLNLTADVAMDSILVVAPSPDVKWPTSLGNNFLVDEGGAAKTETLLVFRPIIFRQNPDQPTTRP